MTRTGVYPELSRRLGEEGVVVLRIDLWRDGSVASVALHRSSGHERLDRAALSAAQSWRFTPRTGSVSLESLLHRVTFRLEDEAGSLAR